MGTDMHIFVERRNSGGPWIPVLVTDLRHELPGSVWDGTASPFKLALYDLRERDYEIFAILSQVRGRLRKPDRTELRVLEEGLPQDISPLTRKEFSEEGYHSHSWATWATMLSAKPIVRSCGAEYGEYYERWLLLVENMIKDFPGHWEKLHCSEGIRSTMSNHALLDIAGETDRFRRQPIDPENLRFIVAYDS